MTIVSRSEYICARSAISGVLGYDIPAYIESQFSLNSGISNLPVCQNIDFGRLLFLLELFLSAYRLCASLIQASDSDIIESLARLGHLYRPIGSAVVVHFGPYVRYVRLAVLPYMLPGGCGITGDSPSCQHRIRVTFGRNLINLFHFCRRQWKLAVRVKYGYRVLSSEL